MDLIQKRKLTGAATIVMISIVISRLTGFIRTMLISYKIGLNTQSDAYYAAFILPDFMFNLLVGGAIAAALIPVLSGYLGRDEEEDGWKAVGTFINVIFLAMIVVCILGIIFAPQIIPVVAPGYIHTLKTGFPAIAPPQIIPAAVQGYIHTEATRLLAIKLTRILFPSVAFLMLAGLSTGILNSYNRFAAAAFGPSIYNIGCALSIYIFGRPDDKSVERVAYGVMLSALLYFILQFSFAFRNMKFYRLKFFLKHSGLSRIIKLAIPSLVSSSIVQINAIISARFVTYLNEGVLTAYKFADTIWQLPLGIFAQGIGIAILPTLSARHATGEVQNYRNVLSGGLRSVLVATIPSAAGIIILGKPLVRAIFQWNAGFDESSVTLTAYILVFFSLALMASSIIAIINRAFYAINDTRTPLLTGMTTILMNYGLCHIFRIFTTLGAAGMALSYSIISTVNAVLLLVLLNRKVGGIGLSKFFVFLGKVIGASIVMGAALYFINRLPVLYNGTKLAQMAFLLFELLAGCTAYALVVLLLKVEEASYVFVTINGKLKLFMDKNVKNTR